MIDDLGGENFGLCVLRASAVKFSFICPNLLIYIPIPPHPTAR
jgi:hypothetical protein